MKKIFLLLMAVLLTLSSCAYYDTPPDCESIEEAFQSNYEYIQIITYYLINSGYTNAYIFEPDGTMLADLNNIPITDTVVLHAISYLFNNNSCYSIVKYGNTISFGQWKGTIQDINCGIAYSINGIDLPAPTFATELIPLEKNGWFYFVADYNLWREKEGQGDAGLGTVLGADCVK